MRRAGLLLALVLWPGALGAQEPRGVEAGAQGLLLVGRRDFAGGGATLGWRPGGGVRLQLAGLGLVVEAGVGGGVRLAVGLRRRWLHGPRRPR